MEYSSFENLFGEWGHYFKEFIESPQMDAIYQKLKSDSIKGKIICPDSSNTFRVFSLCKPSDLKVIWYLQDPYPTIKNKIKVASGIAVDCSATGILQPSLELLYSGMKDCLYPNEELKFDKNPDLSYLVRSGVLLINNDLTCEAFKSGNHSGLWIDFQRYFIEEVLNKYFSGLIYVFSGKSSEKLSKFVLPFNSYSFFTEHMAAASYKNRDWNHEDVFKKINIILKQNQGVEINWLNLKEEDSDLPPF